MARKWKSNSCESLVRYSPNKGLKKKYNRKNKVDEEILFFMQQ